MLSARKRRTSVRIHVQQGRPTIGKQSVHIMREFSELYEATLSLLDVEVHPDGLLIIRNAQANDAGRYR